MIRGIRSLAIRALGGGRPAVRVGDVAPPLGAPSVPEGSGELALYRGRWLVLFFFPRADTPACTVEACALDGLASPQVVIVGVSRDARSSQHAFREKYGLQMPLIADHAGEVCRRYGVLGRLGAGPTAQRVTFIINPEGTIAAVLMDIDVHKHEDRVRVTLTELGCP